MHYDYQIVKGIIILTVCDYLLSLQL